MTLLSSAQLTAEIKQKQIGQVDRLKSKEVQPCLAVVQSKKDPVIDTFVELKKLYAQDIGAKVKVNVIDQAKIPDLLAKLNQDALVHGIIIQLPLPNPSQTDELVKLINPTKDVDALSRNSKFTPPTPLAILSLLDHFHIKLKPGQVLLVGRGRLVGRPLERLLLERGVKPRVIDKPSSDLARLTRRAKVIISATGSPGVLGSTMIQPGTVVIDAGIASEAGRIVGDVDPAAFDRQDISITPPKGGVGPLTITYLFENLLTAAAKFVAPANRSKP